jgi:hypothetical protein
VRREGDLVTEFALPDDADTPAERFELVADLSVPLDIFIEFPGPKIDSGFRGPRVRASGVPVPEATVDQHDRMPSRQRNVGLAGQSFLTQSETVAQAVQDFTDGDFGSRVRIPDQPHDLRTAFSCDGVHTAPLGVHNCACADKPSCPHGSRFPGHSARASAACYSVAAASLDNDRLICIVFREHIRISAYTVFIAEVATVAKGVFALAWVN